MLAYFFLFLASRCGGQGTAVGAYTRGSLPVWRKCFRVEGPYLVCGCKRTSGVPFLNSVKVSSLFCYIQPTGAYSEPCHRGCTGSQEITHRFYREHVYLEKVHGGMVDFNHRGPRCEAGKNQQKVEKGAVGGG